MTKKKKKRMEQLINQTEFKYFARKEINWATSPVYFHGRFLTSTELLNKWSENFKKTKRFHFFLEGLVWSGGKKNVFFVVQRDIWRMRKLLSPLCSCWWIKVCLQSLSWPWTPGKRDEMSHHMLQNQIQPTMAHKRTPSWRQHSKK